MQGKLRNTLGVICVAMALSACDRDRVPQLMNITSTDGPDEFAILPNKPLQPPVDYTALPQPTPGGANLVDPTPNADAVAALGGNPNRLRRDNASAGDGAILAHTTRFGRAGGIRETLAAADEEYRRQNDGLVLERLFNVNIYNQAYAAQSLDAYRELERFRRLGVRTPSAPPEPIEE